MTVAGIRSGPQTAVTANAAILALIAAPYHVSFLRKLCRRQLSRSLQQLIVQVPLLLFQVRALFLLQMPDLLLEHLKLKLRREAWRGERHER